MRQLAISLQLKDPRTHNKLLLRAWYQPKIHKQQHMQMTKVCDYTLRTPCLHYTTALFMFTLCLDNRHLNGQVMQVSAKSARRVRLVEMAYHICVLLSQQMQRPLQYLPASCVASCWLKLCLPITVNSWQVLSAWCARLIATVKEQVNV